LVETPERETGGFWPAPEAPADYLSACLADAGLSVARAGVSDGGTVPGGDLVVGWELAPDVVGRLETSGVPWVSVRCAPWEYGRWIVEVRSSLPLPGRPLGGFPAPGRPPARRVQMLANAVLLLPDPPHLAGELRQTGQALSLREEDLLGLYATYAMVVVHHSFVTDPFLSCRLFELGVQVRFDPLEVLLASADLRALAGADPLVGPFSRAQNLAPVSWTSGRPGGLYPARRLGTAAFWRELIGTAPP
jgi:hypothetical protein